MFCFDDQTSQTTMSMLDELDTIYLARRQLIMSPPKHAMNLCKGTKPPYVGVDNHKYTPNTTPRSMRNFASMRKTLAKKMFEPF